MKKLFLILITLLIFSCGRKDAAQTIIGDWKMDISEELIDNVQTNSTNINIEQNNQIFLSMYSQFRWNFTKDSVTLFAENINSKKFNSYKILQNSSNSCLIESDNRQYFINILSRNKITISNDGSLFYLKRD